MGIKLNIYNTKIMHVGKKEKENFKIICNREQIPQVKEYEHSGIMGKQIKKYQESKLNILHNNKTLIRKKRTKLQTCKSLYL